MKKFQLSPYTNQPQPIADDLFLVTLSASTAQSVTIPNGATIAVFSSTGDFYVNKDTTASISGSASTGHQSVNFDSIAGSDPISLPNYSVAYQQVTVGGAKTLNSGTGFTKNVAGYQLINFSVTAAPTLATGFSQTDTAFLTVVINIDGAGDATYNFRKCDLLTLQDVINALNYRIPGINATLSTTTLKVTTLTNTAAGSIAINSSSTLFSGLASYSSKSAAVAPVVLTYTGSIGIDTTAATAGYQIVNVGGAKTGASATGLANDTTAYTANVVIDGVTKSVSVVGSAAQTFTTLVAEINTDLSTAGTASISGGNVKIISATTGASSTVAITDTGGNHLFSSLTGYVAILTAVAGVAAHDTDTVSLSYTGSQAQSIGDLIALINADLAGHNATIALNGGNLRVTGTTTTSVGSINIADSGSHHLFGSLTSYSAIASAVTPAQIAYTATIAVDGDASPTALSFNAGNFTTFTTLASAIDNAMDGDLADCAITSGKLVVTSRSTGVASSIRIVDTNLFSSIPEFLNLIAPVDGNAPVGPELNPTVKDVVGNTYLSLISAGTPKITVSFYN